MLIVYQYNGLQPMLLDLSLANKKTLINTNEPAICDINTGQRIFGATVVTSRSQYGCPL